VKENGLSRQLNVTGFRSFRSASEFVLTKFQVVTCGRNIWYWVIWK